MVKEHVLALCDKRSVCAYMFHVTLKLLDGAGLFPFDQEHRTCDDATQCNSVQVFGQA